MSGLVYGITGFLLILGLVLIETLVIYALFIAIFIVMIQWGNYY